MINRSESSHVVHDVIPIFEALGYPGAGDHERVKINDVPVLRPSGGRSGASMDVVYYHDGEPLVIVEAKRENKNHKTALKQAQRYRKNFPIENKDYAPTGRAPVFLSTVVGKDVKFYQDIFTVENNQLKQEAKIIDPIKFTELVEFYGLSPVFRPKILTPDLFNQLFLSELLKMYNIAGRNQISPQLIVRVSAHILNYLVDEKKYIHEIPFTDLDDFPHKQKAIIDLHKKFDLKASLGPILGNEYRRFIVRAFQGTALNQYLTPQSVISFMTDLAGPFGESSHIIDFECGSGGFLADIFKSGQVPLENVIGIDIDSKPVIFARTYLALQMRLTGKEVNSLPIKKANGLLFDNNNWDFVIGNPSGSAKYVGRDLKKILKHLSFAQEKQIKISHYSEYELSLRQAIRLAKEGGKICLVIPEGVLSNANDDGLREYIAQNCKIITIIGLPRGTFKKGVTSKSLHSGGHAATMKMNILLMHKLKSTAKQSGDYPIFLAQVYDCRSTPRDIDAWLTSRLKLIYIQWKNWLKTKSLSLLDNVLLENAQAVEISLSSKKALFKNPNQQELI